MSLIDRLRNFGPHRLNVSAIDRDEEGTAVPLPRMCDVCHIEPASYGMDGSWYCPSCWFTRFAPWSEDDSQ